MNVSVSQLPANVMAPRSGLGDPMTVICGAPTRVAPEIGVPYSTHASAGVTRASPLDVVTMALELPPIVPMPDWPPNATLMVSGCFVVLVNVSSQRPQLALVLT